MPGNNIIYYKAESNDVQQLKFKNMNTKLDEIASIVGNNQTNQYKSKSIIKNYLLTGVLHKLIIKSYLKQTRITGLMMLVSVVVPVKKYVLLKT